MVLLPLGIGMLPLESQLAGSRLPDLVNASL